LEQASKGRSNLPAIASVVGFRALQIISADVMNWSSLHRESENLAADAQEALQRGESARAEDLFVQAATAEMRAFESIGPDKPRTLSVTGVSAVSLWYKAGRLDEAEQLAHRAAAIGAIPAFAVAELRTLLQTIWNEHAQKEAGI
jgi:hypothetical protein